MIEAGHLTGPSSVHFPAIKSISTKRAKAPLLGAIAEFGLAVTFILVPLQFFQLQQNVAPVDVWSMLLLPIYWLYLTQIRQTIRLPYIGAMWLILLGSLVGTFFAINPAQSLVAVGKDVYLYVGFVTVAAVLASFGPSAMQRTMAVWAGVVLLHGGLLIGEFVSPDLLQQVSSYVAGFGEVNPYRASGLFYNPNLAGAYQLLGFVPLMTARPRRLIAWPLGTFLFLSIAATGSLASMIGFAAGLIVATFARAFHTGSLNQSVRMITSLMVPILILAGLTFAIINSNPDLQEALDYITVDRADRSAEGRFELWDRGFELLRSPTALWGIGPDSYQALDELALPLHNDLLSFVVERGILGLLGLLLLFALTVGNSYRILRDLSSEEGETGVVAVFFGTMVAAVIFSQFHQIFHYRWFWLVLAVQDALLLRYITGRLETKRSARSVRLTEHDVSSQVQRHSLTDL